MLYFFVTKHEDLPHKASFTKQHRKLMFVLSPNFERSLYFVFPGICEQTIMQNVEGVWTTVRHRVEAYGYQRLKDTGEHNYDTAGAIVAIQQPIGGKLKASKNRNLSTPFLFQIRYPRHITITFVNTAACIYFQTVSGRVRYHNSATFHAKVACFLLISHRLILRNSQTFLLSCAE